MGFTKSELEAFRDRPVDDLIAPGVRLLFVGINPGLWTAATNTHFARPGNRFYPALHLAGITDRLLDPTAGLDTEARQHLLDRGVGVTNLVNRATVRADELTPAELQQGAVALTSLVEMWQPRIAAVLGVTAYRTGFSRPRAVAGRQPERLGGADLFVLGNPSGLECPRDGGVAGAFVQGRCRGRRRPARPAWLVTFISPRAPLCPGVGVRPWR